MRTFAQQMQEIFAEYEKEVSAEPTDLYAVGRWAVEKGLWKPRPEDVLMRFADQMARSLREEYRVDEKGRHYRVKHAVRTNSNGKQISLWADIDKAPRPHMLKAFAQRRRQIVGDCLQLRLDVDHYNDVKRQEEPIQLVLDFTDDVSERLLESGIEEAE